MQGLAPGVWRAPVAAQEHDFEIFVVNDRLQNLVHWRDARAPTDHVDAPLAAERVLRLEVFARLLEAHHGTNTQAP